MTSPMVDAGAVVNLKITAVKVSGVSETLIPQYFPPIP